MSKFKGILVVIAALFILTPSVFADGDETAEILRSPGFLSGGRDLTATESPVYDILNPAASALQQRVTLDLSAAGLFNGQPNGGFNGGALNLGGTLPTRFGVFTANAFLMGSSALQEINLGIQGGLQASFSKELYPGILAGAGLNFGFGESFAATLDLGFIHMPGDISFMKDFRWAVVLSDFGYSGFSATDYPSPFTLGAGAGFSVVDTEAIGIRMNSSILFPTFTNIRFDLGTDISLFDTVGIKASSRVDLAELLQGDSSGLVPSFGLYFRFRTGSAASGEEEHIWDQSDFKTSAAAGPMADGLWAIGAGASVNLGVIDNDPPEIELDLSGFEGFEASLPEDEDAEDVPPEEISFKKAAGKGRKAAVSYAADDPQKSSSEKSTESGGRGPDGSPGVPVIAYISPDNDGVKDSIVIPVRIKDSRYIKGFAFIVTDSDGNEIKRIENKEKRPENLGLANIIERLFYVETGVDIPESIRWDGLTDAGTVAPDGTYLFRMEAWDDNNNTARTSEYAIVIDNTPPELVIEKIDAEDKIFSPNGDGNKDSVRIIQSGSAEDSWRGLIKSASGDIYKHYNWISSSPESFEWDGKDDSKNLVPDGVYFYYIESTDRAGNSVSGEVANLIINTESTPIALTVDQAYFSPGSTEARASVNFLPEIPVKSGIMRWSMDISDSKGNIKYSYRGSNEVPEQFVFDGKDKDGNFVGEGTYKARLKLYYINGNNPEAESPAVTVDVTPPAAGVRLSSRIFSPNGDGNKDEVIIYQETSDEDYWFSEIRDADGKPVRTFKWVRNAESVLEWTGKTDAGALAPDGEYTYVLFSEDRAGNRGSSEAASFRLDTEETPVILSADPEAFSPDGDGIKDNLLLDPVISVNEGIKSYQISIRNSGGETVRTISGRGSLKSRYSWDGFTDSGSKAADGTYSAELEVVYEKGDISRASARNFVIDTVYPEIEISSAYTLFSPDGDGRRDGITIVQTSGNEQLFSSAIVNARGETVREFFWKEKLANLYWDGSDENGNRLPDGKYSYTVWSSDPAGNRTERKITGIEIDTRPASVFVTADLKGFTPDNDGTDDVISLKTITTLKDGVKDWKLDIRSADGRTVRSFTGDALPEMVIWDGRSENGRITDGRYKAVYSVEYIKGNRPESETKEFIIDLTAPGINVGISPLPFSPDNDGIDDELSIALDVSETNAVSSWKFEIVDREGNPFMSYEGSGMPAGNIIWDGRSSSGELVIAAEDYPYRFTVTDEFGNRSSSIGVIPVDVLVIKEDGKLKIRIANINFAPDSPELVSNDPEIMQKNEYVLGRLSEILRKYESYRIVIEGHAVSVFWADKVRAEREESEELIPLSKARAETVKSYLALLGINEARMSTTGIGGKKPIVPHSDLDNRWKNRRVEFILIKGSN